MADGGGLTRADPASPSSAIEAPACRLPWLWERLRCPACRERLTGTPATLRCGGCGTAYPQRHRGALELMPPTWSETGPDWMRRQDEMEAWYAKISAERAAVRDAYLADYSLFADTIATLDGVVLDVGGGNGIARHWLARRPRYAVVDPELRWLGHDWEGHAATFPSFAEPLPFIRGVGESLPLADASFDAVLNVFSLNHVVSPPQTLREIARVLRPGGRFVLVLDDLAPRWRELPGLVWKRQLPLRTPLRRLLGGWPLQSDHLRITDAELAEWTEGLFDVTARRWRGPYLVQELARRD